jgi:hypothetical protein
MDARINLWSFCNVYLCIQQQNRFFDKKNTHKMVAKVKKLRTIKNRLMLICVFVCILTKSQPYWGQSIFVTVGSYIKSNQIIAGSYMVRHMKLILVLSLPLIVYYLMRCTPHDAPWGVVMTSFDST